VLSLILSPNVNAQNAAVINLDSTYQMIRGFGAANILQWRLDMTASEIETAFGTGDGQLGFTILRLPIQPEKNLWSTNVPTAKAAYDMGVTIIAAPWDAPAEMLETVGYIHRVRYDMYDEYAAHLEIHI
jgi:glucuronoarabinoxylan endo-1,4-beta-xylanase